MKVFCNYILFTISTKKRCGRIISTFDDFYFVHVFLESHIKKYRFKHLQLFSIPSSVVYNVEFSDNSWTLVQI